MKILHYYWTHHDDEKPGGGIKVYLNNLIKIQSRQHDVSIINSGTAYTFRSSCYIKKISEDKMGIKKYSIINSPILAPSKCSFLHIDAYLYDEILVNVIREFLLRNYFDVIHFHSLEGISINVLGLKKEFPNIKFVLTMHNYYVFCPQVNLWYKDSISCDDFKHGNRCNDCILNVPDYNMVKFSYMVQTYLKSYGLNNMCFSLGSKLKEIYNKNKKTLSNNNDVTSEDRAWIYDEFRQKNVNYINEFVDTVICVSKRVAYLTEKFGVCRDKIVVKYIGTEVAKKQLKTIAYTNENNVLQIAYMGYMRADKGFFFFVEALDKMDVKIASNISVVIAARFDNVEYVNKIKKISSKFNKILLYDGYNKENIDKILMGTNLGIVPVLWEDNLPQVAIEFKAKGIPVLASDKGGASELSYSKKFVFQAGNINEFNKKIEYFLYNKEELSEYYYVDVNLLTMSDHMLELKKIYE